MNAEYILYIKDWHTLIEQSQTALDAFVTRYGKISHFVTHEINRTEYFAMLP